MWAMELLSSVCTDRYIAECRISPSTTVMSTRAFFDRLRRHALQRLLQHGEVRGQTCGQPAATVLGERERCSVTSVATQRFIDGETLLLDVVIDHGVDAEQR